MLATAVGWVGTAGTLGAYLMLTQGRLHATSLTYALLNTTGGLLGAFASAAFGAWPSATANLIWALISLRTVAEILPCRLEEESVGRLRARQEASLVLVAGDHSDHSGCETSGATEAVA